MIPDVTIWTFSIPLQPSGSNAGLKPENSLEQFLTFLCDFSVTRDEGTTLARLNDLWLDAFTPRRSIKQLCR